MRNRRRMRRTFPLIDQLDDRCLLSAYGQPQIRRLHAGGNHRGIRSQRDHVQVVCWHDR